jgi:hypothetical protein
MNNQPDLWDVRKLPGGLALKLRAGNVHLFADQPVRINNPSG